MISTKPNTKIVKVQALMSHLQKHGIVNPGDVFEMTFTDARYSESIGRVKFVVEDSVAVEAPEDATKKRARK